MGASVWMMSGMEYEDVENGLSFDTDSDRPSALTKPTVMLFSRSKGLPMATASCPTLTVVESPIVTGCSNAAGASTWITARSESGSVPTTVASTMVPSWKRTRI